MSDYPDLHLLVGGEKLGASGRETMDVLDPATGETIAALPKAGKGDLDTALANAESGFKEWRKTGADQREATLRKGAQNIRDRVAEIAAALTREQGKPLAEAKGETMYSAMLLEFYAGECKRLYGRTLVRPEGSRVEVQQHPVGPVAGFAAWNFPSLNVMRKIGGPLAAGCSVIVKPSEETPAAGLMIAQALIDAGVPGEVLQVVFGVPDEEIRTIESELTLVGGRPTHASGPFEGRAPTLAPIEPAWSPVREFGGYRSA